MAIFNSYVSLPEGNQHLFPIKHSHGIVVPPVIGETKLWKSPVKNNM
jgi:hypothetical protein